MGKMKNFLIHQRELNFPIFISSAVPSYTIHSKGKYNFRPTKGN